MRRRGVNSTQPGVVAPLFLVQTTQQLPPSLFAPRYSHSLEEAKFSSKQDSLGHRTPDKSPAPLTPPANDGPAS